MLAMPTLCLIAIGDIHPVAGLGGGGAQKFRPRFRKIIGRALGRARLGSGRARPETIVHNQWQKELFGRDQGHVSL